jgi:predicted metal-binding protein
MEKNFAFLQNKARELGAIEAKIIQASDIVVEDRVILKCKTGCDNYGSKLCCPPYAPTIEEFRRMLNEYHYALFMKFRSDAETDEATARNLMRNIYDPNVSGDLKEGARKFDAEWYRETKRILLAMLDLEQAAFNNGYPFAVGFTSGSCTLCAKCNVASKICIHPTMMRFPEHAVGINIIKTAERVGSSIKFPFKGKPERIGLVLID